MTYTPEPGHRVRLERDGYAIESTVLGVSDGYVRLTGAGYQLLNSGTWTRLPDPEPPAPVYEAGKAYQDADGEHFLRFNAGWRGRAGFWYPDGDRYSFAPVLPMTLLVPEGRDREALRAHLRWLGAFAIDDAHRHLLSVAPWLTEGETL